MKYGIGSVWNCINPKISSKELATNPFDRIAYMACFEELPEMKFGTIEDTINALNDVYINDVYIRTTDDGVEVNVYYVIDQNRNLIAILNYDKNIIMNEKFNYDNY